MSASTLALVLTGHVARRLLPLSLLLRVGVVFPDATPRRFGVALRAVRPRKGDDHHGPASALGMLAALLTHDRRTRGHSERVAAYALLIADELGLDEVARNEVRWAGLLHDVGKIDVPCEILNKPGGLDQHEWAVMSSHPVAGVACVEPLQPWLGDALQAVDGHHECWDGSGYPRGIPAGNLPLSTRIMALANAVKTMTTARPYKSPMSMHEARAEVASCAGSQFDPAVARAFLGVSVPQLWRVAGPLACLAQAPLLSVVLQGSLAPAAAFVQGAVLTAGQAAGTAAFVATALVASGAGPAEQAAAQRATMAASTVVTDPGEDAMDGTGAGEGRSTIILPQDEMGTADGPGSGHPSVGSGTGSTAAASSLGASTGGAPMRTTGGGDPVAPSTIPAADRPGPMVPPPGQGDGDGQDGVPPGQGDGDGQDGVPPGQGDGDGQDGVPPGQGHGDGQDGVPSPGQGDGDGQHGVPSPGQGDGDGAFVS
jgi:putative nucleotidyltransferase with HDIG domain